MFASSGCPIGRSLFYDLLVMKYEASIIIIIILISVDKALPVVRKR
jgi:hypothetical protein